MFALTAAAPAFGAASDLTVTSPANGSFPNASPTFIGTASHDAGDGSNVTVNVYASGTATPVQSLPTTQTGGAWSVSASGALADGHYTVDVAQLLSGATTPTTSPPNAFTVDTTAPTSSASPLPPQEPVTGFGVGYTTGDATSGVLKVELFAKGPNDTGYQKVGEDDNPQPAGTIGFTPTGGEGAYSFYTIATDRAGNAETAPSAADATTTVGPSASFGMAPALATTGQLVTFTSSSSVEGGSEVWGLNGSLAGNGNSFSHVFSAPGNYFVQLHVSDAHGSSDSARWITIADRPPVASFLFTPSNPLTGDTITFASTSSDPDDPIVSQSWDLNGDGVFGDASGPTATAWYTKPGAHTVSVRVTDASGVSAVATRSITVAARPGARPQLLLPFPIVRIAGRVNRSGATLRVLTVQAPAGAAVEVRCRGRGCPWKRKRRVAPGRVGGGLKLVSFGGFRHRLSPGVVIEIRVTRKDHVGKYTRFVIRRNLAPARTDSCLMPGRSTPRRCPAS